MAEKKIKIPSDVAYSGELHDWIYKKLERMTELDGATEDIHVSIVKETIFISSKDIKSVDKLFKRLKPQVTKSANPLIAALKQNLQDGLQ